MPPTIPPDLLSARGSPCWIACSRMESFTPPRPRSCWPRRAGRPIRRRTRQIFFPFNSTRIRIAGTSSSPPAISAPCGICPPRCRFRGCPITAGTVASASAPIHPSPAMTKPKNIQLPAPAPAPPPVSVSGRETEQARLDEMVRRRGQINFSKTILAPPATNSGLKSTLAP